VVRALDIAGRLTCPAMLVLPIPNRLWVVLHPVRALFSFVFGICQPFPTLRMPS